MQVKMLEIRDRGTRPYKYKLTPEGRMCSRCGNVLPPTREFWHHRSNGKVLTPCKRCIAIKDRAPHRAAKRVAATRRYRATLSPARVKEISRRDGLKKNYGITLAEYEAMFDAQGRACAICGIKDERHDRFWHVDHCHSTGVVRGILCASCNVMLGHSKENPSIFRNAIAYLEGYAMEVKILEVRDRATFIPVMCIRPLPDNEAQRYLLRRDGYSCDPADDIVIYINAQCLGVAYDPYNWGSGSTHMVAHDYIRRNWEHLHDGDVVDVEFILGHTSAPKTSERLEP